MEDNRARQPAEVRTPRRGDNARAPVASPVHVLQASRDATSSPPDAPHNVHAGICNGRHGDCMVAGQAAVQGEGVRRQAQVRLNDCEVDYKRLTSSVAHDDLELQRHHRQIRRLMRETYGALRLVSFVCPLALAPFARLLQQPHGMGPTMISKQICSLFMCIGAT